MNLKRYQSCKSISLLVRLIYGMELRKQRLFKLITLYKEFFELVESVENLNKNLPKLIS